MQTVPAWGTLGLSGRTDISVNKNIISYMKYFQIKFLAFFILTATSSCDNKPTIEINQTKKESNELSLHLTSVREYTVPYHGEVYFEKITDTLMQKRFEIGLSIKNNTDHLISIWLMTCSWQQNVIINNPYIFYAGRNCDHNFPSPHKIKSHDSIYLTGVLTRDLLFENSCKNCIGTDNVNVETTKLGLIYIDTIMCKTHEEYMSTIEDKSKWNKIIWSNPLYLNKK
jgi:hypothetical protein